MLLAMGNSPIISKLRNTEISRYVLLYPEFFDNKKKLIQRKFAEYVLEVWRNRNTIKIALYPDYVYFDVNLPRNITYIYPVHDLEKDIKFVEKTLEQKYNIFYGFASNEELRNYTLDEFLHATHNKKRWYLGISSKHELREAIENKFDGFDFTTMLLGNFSQIKNIEYVKRKILEIVKMVNSNN